MQKSFAKATCNAMTYCCHTVIARIITSTHPTQLSCYWPVLPVQHRVLPACKMRQSGVALCVTYAAVMPAASPIFTYSSPIFTHSSPIWVPTSSGECILRCREPYVSYTPPPYKTTARHTHTCELHLLSWCVTYLSSCDACLFHESSVA